ncbi:MAG TPA: hypothetical protein PKB02_00480 [Anaerohalosphaeraceae bacterium]|nr:hypothetical protein [Anaerohalosphaeraceae bacterium]
MKSRQTHPDKQRNGSALGMVMILMVLLTIAGLSLIRVAEGKLIQAVRYKSQESAAAAAEAAYEKAVFWMSQQVDMLEALESSSSATTITFPQSHADYKISFAAFIGARPIFQIQANGYCGIYQKTISVYLVQAVSGWDMGMCRIISGPNTTDEVNFVTGEIIAMPLHINDMQDNPDYTDIHISGSPQFLEHISLGESRYDSRGRDKYASTINLFQAGISFNQPASLVVDPATIRQKVQRFRDCTNPTYRYSPQAVQALPKHNNGRTGFYTSSVTDLPAVQLKFYVDSSGVGYVRVYNDCTVAGYTRQGSGSNSWDYKINTTGSNHEYIKYPIYGCHYTPGSYTDIRIDNPADAIYVSQNFNGVRSEPGAQIYVDGNVVIGCGSEDAAALGTINTVKGSITVVASGNIWVANELKVAGDRDADGMPATDNPNVLGLISQGVIKVVDPGMTRNDLLYDTDLFDASSVSGYSPIGNQTGSGASNRVLPGTMTVEAAMTIGGGGWGAENVYRLNSSPGRRNYYSSKNDKLIVRGTITESLRGIVGSGTNGYIKQYYFDKRLMKGILPGNMSLKGKYLLVPGGWSETSTIRSE